MAFRKDPDIYVTVRQDFTGAGVEIVVYRRADAAGVEILTVDPHETGRSGQLVYRWSERRRSFDSITPNDIFMHIAGFAPQLLAALSEAGVPAPDRSFTEGKLAAIEDHLTDMRRLVFEPETERIVVERKDQ